jgi:hypothetical protein
MVKRKRLSGTLYVYIYMSCWTSVPTAIGVLLCNLEEFDFAFWKCIGCTWPQNFISSKCFVVFFLKLYISYAICRLLRNLPTQQNSCSQIYSINITLLLHIFSLTLYYVNRLKKISNCLGTWRSNSLGMWRNNSKKTSRVITSHHI